MICAAMRKTLLISLVDLRFVSVSCKHCRTRVLLDLREPSEHAKTFGTLLPNECPGCRAGYDSALNPGLLALQSAYRELLKIEKQIEFSTDVVSEKNEQGD